MAYQINQELCSCCHRCRVECPQGAIRFKGSKYWIDPEKCISCGRCAEVCHNDVISDPEHPRRKMDAHETVHRTCDVVVIGAGAAGTAAAARAASQGRKVLILEKNKEQGGSAWYAHVFRSLWSKWHEDAGLTDPRDGIYKEFMEKTHGQVNGKLVRRILDADAEFIDWLIDEHDLGRDWIFGPQPFGGYGPVCQYDWEYNHKRIDTTIGPGGTGWYMCNKLLQIALDNGAEILYRTAARNLILDRSGTVCGVVAEDEGGTIEITCRSCIVAAGAFSRNREMREKFQPGFNSAPGEEDVHVFTCATCTGDGISMCEELGCDIDYYNTRVGMFGPMRHPFGTASIAAACNPYGVDVQRDGTPYPGSQEPSVISPLAKVPGRYVWHVLDERSVEQAERESMGRTPDVVGINMDAFYANWREELNQELEWETMYRADTLEELARAIGADPAALQHSVDGFNASPSSPRKIGPEGPFYAVKMKMFHENSIGGIAVDENMNVLRGGRVVPGLYAVGDNCRGEMVHGVVGMNYIEGTISALTFALCSGYIAGGEVVR